MYKITHLYQSASQSVKTTMFYTHRCEIQNHTVRNITHQQRLWVGSKYVDDSKRHRCQQPLHTMYQHIKSVGVRWKDQLDHKKTLRNVWWQLAAIWEGAHETKQNLNRGPNANSHWKCEAVKLLNRLAKRRSHLLVSSKF